MVKELEINYKMVFNLLKYRNNMILKFNSEKFNNI